MNRGLEQGDVIMMVASSIKVITDPKDPQKKRDQYSQAQVMHKNPDKNFDPQILLKNALAGIKVDIQNYKRIFKVDEKNRRLIHSAQSSYLQSKKSILNQIADFFKSGKRKVYLIYTGHGHENGDWKIETEQNDHGDRITLNQIIDLWSKNKNDQANLILYMDSCFSGQWCYRIIQQQKINSISIIASSSYDQKSNSTRSGSLFCKLLFEQQADFQGNYTLMKNNQNPKFIIKGEYFISNPTEQHFRLARSFVNVNNIRGQPIDYDSFQWWVNQKPFCLQSKNKDQGNEKQIESIYTQKNGDIYDGSWKKRANQENVQQWIKQGKGKMIYANGDTYDGQWKNNVRHGQGTLSFVNDQGQPAGLYTGFWQNDLPNGYGTHFYSIDMTYRYEGNWKDARRQGQGQLFYNDQEVVLNAAEQ